MKNYNLKTMGGSTSSNRQYQHSERPEGDVVPLHKKDMDRSACESTGHEAHHHSVDRLDEPTNSTKVTDLDLDSLVICASNLSLRDLTNMAMTCQRFRDAAYSDTVWEIQCRLAYLNSFAINFVYYSLRQL